MQTEKVIFEKLVQVQKKSTIFGDKEEVVGFQQAGPPPHDVIIVGIKFADARDMPLGRIYKLQLVEVPTTADARTTP